MALAAAVGHTDGLSERDADIRRFEPPGRVSDDDFGAVDKRGEQQSTKLVNCSVAWTRQDYTKTIRERVGITIVHQCDPGVLTLNLGPRNDSSDGPYTNQYSQPISQHS